MTADRNTGQEAVDHAVIIRQPFALAEGMLAGMIEDGREPADSLQMAEARQIIADARAALAALEQERQEAFGMCGSCSAWAGTTTGCEECSEFMEESGHNGRRADIAEAAEARIISLENEMLDKNRIAAEAEVRRLREALIATTDPGASWNIGLPAYRIARLRHFVEAALAAVSVAAADNTLREEDIKIEPWGRYRHPHMEGGGTGQTGVKITHLPTGREATCDSEASQLRNKQIALNALAALSEGETA